MNKAILHFYKQARAWQMETYGDTGVRRLNKKGEYVSEKKFNGGGAVVGQHAYAAYLSAKSSIRFRADMKKRFGKKKAK